MKTGIFGGTFNPPHLGHKSAAIAAIKALDLDRLILIPTAQPPHKALPRFSATAEQRLCMTKLLAADTEGMEVSDVEIRRGGKSYTFETLEEIKKLYPQDELYLLVGTDMLRSFHTWKNPERICELAHVAVCSREKDDREQIRQDAQRISRTFGGRVHIIENQPIVFSSTEAREGNSGELPQSVQDYIKDQCLYIDHEKLTESVKARLSPKRFAHTLGTRELACELAGIYGEKENRAFCAATLHDCTKELTLAEQQALAQKYGIEYDYDEQNIKELIHADTAAAVARHEFGMCSDVCRAIAYHTTGNAEMTLLDKIIYTADACEETRTWDKAPELRELAKLDLDAAVIFLLEETIKRLEKNGKKPYYRTQTAAYAMKKNGKE